MTGTGGLLLLLSSWATISVATDVCSTFIWDAAALSSYCTTPGAPAYRSPACSVYRLCNGNASPPLGSTMCSTDRLFISLCADQTTLSQCKTFQQAFSTPADFTTCQASKAFKIISTALVQNYLTTNCAGGHRMAGCERCNATACDTADPLLAYTDSCIDMLMGGCEPWEDLCAAESPAAAQLLCLPASQRTTTTAGSGSGAGSGVSSSTPPPFSADPCVLDSTAPACKSYVYPDAAAQADIAKLCGSMPDMPGCAVVAVCEQGGGKKVAAKYCRPFTLLATLCADMPGMKGCEAYKGLCGKAGSVVAQCADQRAIPGLPTWSVARKDVFSACDDHPMAACASCSSTDCPDPLGSLAGICHEMPNMAVCKDFWGFCNVAGAQDVAEWCEEDDSKYLPSMLMYFHQRTQELLLWKEWRPMTEGQYAGSVIAILAMGVATTGLKTLKGYLSLRWAHDRAALGDAAPVPASVWLPAREQLSEIAIKCGITGISLTLDYFMMLIAMTFNIGFFCAVIGGYILGALLFGHVLDNYGAILHHQRRVAHAKARRGSGDTLRVNGAAHKGGPSAANGSSATRLTTSDEEEEEDEEAFRVTVADADCNCVHSA
ncbi:hypothetical protein HXX76_002168 [Chlamydomonas incerta]|uniref:Copper transporter n=1 Tax=Chlamydomonas incerta TaxID=51695 RepID=A0A836B032_CHLIN|nr:hypothetical protein HXX76_002168 [Chlamydomonas incerta]|eukprot:KAG2443825.1 hypothetical protein HXX76_002168 [Chlamydomonas incerta]